MENFAIDCLLTWFAWGLMHKREWQHLRFATRSWLHWAYCWPDNTWAVAWLRSARMRTTWVGEDFGGRGLRGSIAVVEMRGWGREKKNLSLMMVLVVYRKERPGFVVLLLWIFFYLIGGLNLWMAEGICSRIGLLGFWGRCWWFVIWIGFWSGLGFWFWADYLGCADKKAYLSIGGILSGDKIKIMRKRLHTLILREDEFHNQI